MKLYHLTDTPAGKAIERYEARKRQPRYLHRSTRVIEVPNKDGTVRRVLIGVTYRKQA